MARSVEVRRVADGELRTEPLLLKDRPNAALFAADGKRVAVLCENGTVALWNTETGEKNVSSVGPWGYRHGHWSPDQTSLAIGDRFFNARLLDVSQPATNIVLAHEDMVLGAVWSADQHSVLTWSYDNTVRVWDATTARPVFAPIRHRGPVVAAAWSPDGKSIASASRDGTARIWGAQTGEPAGPWFRHGDEVLHVSWSSDGERLLTTSADGSARLWRVSSNRLSRWVLQTEHPIQRVSFSPDGKQIAAFNLGNDAFVWSTATGERVATLSHKSRAVLCGWPDSQHLVTAGAGLRTWDLVTSQIIFTQGMAGRLPGYNFENLSPDGRLVAESHPTLPPVLREVETEKLRATLGTSRVSQFAFSLDSRVVATVRGREVELWDTVTGAKRAGAITIEPRTIYIRLNADGTRLACVTANNSVFIFETQNGRRIGEPLMHTAAVRSVAFSPDDRLIATVGHDKALRLWDASSGEPAAPPLLHPSWLMDVSARADGMAFATGENGGRVHVWELPAGEGTAEQMEATARRIGADLR